MPDASTPDPTIVEPTLPVEPVVDTTPVIPEPPEQKPVETPLPGEAEKTDRDKLLAGIDSVLKPAADATKPAVEPAKEAAAAEPEKPADKPVEDTDKDDDKLAFKDDPRFQALRTEAIESRAKLKEYDTKIAEANANLVPLVNLRSFLADSGVSGDEFANGLQIMRALKTDPILAAQLLKPHLDAIHAHTGEGELPPDLKTAVESGEISDALARETVRLRASASVAQAQAQRVVQQTSQADSQRVLQEAQTAVMAWEQGVIKSDPDYLRLQPLVARLIQASAAKGTPRNSQEALTLATEAYTEAKRLLPKPVAPPRPATKLAPSTATGSQARTVVTAKPKNLLDGVGQLLAGLGK